MAALCADVLALWATAGLGKMGVVALDGTKIEANAALAANWTAETIAKDVPARLAEAQAPDVAEDRLYGTDRRRGDDLPEALRSRDSRPARLRECQERLKREAAEAPPQAKIEARQAEEAARGQKKRGRTPQAQEHPQAIGPALADAGDCSEAALLIAPNKDWHQRRR